MDLKGQVAVVTGASRGVGRAIADARKARGLIVAKVARGSARFAADVSDPADVARLKTAVETELGRPTVLVNAAGIFGPIALVKDSDPKEWIETLMIDAVGPYLVSRAFLDGMIDGGWGRIVNLSSAASLHTPGPLNSAYATAKVALNQFTRHLAAELEATGVTANVIHPGALTDVVGILPHVEKALRELQRQGRAGKTIMNYQEALAALCDCGRISAIRRARSRATEAATTTGWRGWTTRVGIRRRRRPSSCSTSSRAT